MKAWNESRIGYSKLETKVEEIQQLYIYILLVCNCLYIKWHNPIFLNAVHVVLENINKISVTNLITASWHKGYGWPSSSFLKGWRISLNHIIRSLADRELWQNLFTLITLLNRCALKVYLRLRGAPFQQWDVNQQPSAYKSEAIILCNGSDLMVKSRR